MKKGYKDHTPSTSFIVLATLCFVTLVMCQTRFQITKEMNREVYPPVLRSKDCWFLYTVGNPDRYKSVLRAFIVMSSPVMSLISTGLLLFGKAESNPYYFIPWLFLTIKGLLLIQTDNLITILRDMATRTNYATGFRLEDLKLLLFYFTIFLIDLVEAFSFCEIFDLFLALWNHHPGYSAESAGLEAVKREIADIMRTWSRCSLGSLSKISLGSLTDSDENTDADLHSIGSLVKFSIKEDDKIFERDKRMDTLSNTKCEFFGQNVAKKKLPNSTQTPSSDGDTPAISAVEDITKTSIKNTFTVDMLKSRINPQKNYPRVEFKEQWKNFSKGMSLETYTHDIK